jgi:membrane protease YdiL (CAAX protease family)
MYHNPSGSPPSVVAELLQAASTAARAGQKGWARDLLTRAIELDETCTRAWLWLSDVAETPEDKARCLERVLDLDPDHDMARRGLSVLRAPRAAPEPHPAPGLKRSEPRVATASIGPAHPDELDGADVLDGHPGDDPRPAAVRTTPSILDGDAMLQEGIDAIYANQPERARELLTRVVELDERHMSAWLWLSYVSDSPQERDRCVARVLSLAHQGPGPAPFRSATRPAYATADTSWPAPVAAAPPPVDGMQSQAARAMPRPVRIGTPGGRGRYDPPDVPFFRSFAIEISAASILVRGAVSEWATTWGIFALAYLAGITVAEALTTFSLPQLGLAVHSLLLLGLLVHSARVTSREHRAFVLSLAFAPLIRILSLSLPLVGFPLLYWYLITSVPLFAAAMVAARSMSYTWRDLGLNLRGWPVQVIIGLTGITFGCVEYYILRPASLAPAFDWRSLLWAALILIVSTGLLEELIFRGLLQRSAGDLLGRWGLAYVALLFAVLHVGYKSAADLIFVFAVGLFFGWAVKRTRSLLGVTLSHGLTNVILFLIMPLLHL